MRSENALIPHFNPRSPHGERPGVVSSITICGWISTHAPRTGSDYAICTVGLIQTDFNPRSPHGERLCGLDCFHLLLGISTHAPRTGSDMLC